MSTNATPDLEGCDDWIARDVETLAPEQRLAAFAQLSEVEHVLAMPDHLLRVLPDSYLDTLPPDARDVVRRRLGR